MRLPAPVHRQEDAGEDVEADGQGGQAVPAAQNESEELAAVHTGHPAGHVPAPEVDLLKKRGPDAPAPCQRALQRLHQQSDAQVQAGHQALQGGQGEDVRRELPLPSQSHQAQPGLLAHAQRAEGHLPQRCLCRRSVSDYKGGCGRLLEEQLW